MKRALTLLILTTLISSCSAQQLDIKAKLLFKSYIYQKGCKAVAPEYFLNNKFYYYYDNMYSFSTNNWCAVKENLNKIPLPQNKDVMDFRVLNDSIAVLVLDNHFEILYYCNFKKGSLIKIDTLVRNSVYEKRLNKKIYKVKKFDFGGASFVSDKFYYLSGSNKVNNLDFVLKVNLADLQMDTVKRFMFENYLAIIKSSQKHIVIQHGADTHDYDLVGNNVISISEKYPTSIQRIDRYQLLDFINDDIVVLHHFTEPEKFVLLNLVNGKTELFELDNKVFRLENIRQEEVLKKTEDGPNDGLNQLKFKYFACRGATNELLLSFADRQENRILYSITFDKKIIQKLN